MNTITILDPTSAPRSRLDRLPPRVDSLAGKVVAILNNRWKSMDLVAERFESALRSRFGVAGVVHRVIPISGAASTALLDEVAASAQVAVVGLAN